MACVLSALPVARAMAAQLRDAAALPHVGAAAREDYLRFLDAAGHRAFAIAPGGAWAWVAQAPSAAEAIAGALERCGGNTAQSCVPYALDDRVVFDAGGWVRLWGPYRSGAEAARAHTGTRRGDRMHRLVFRDAQGRARALADFAGRVVVLHFWGSWCAPCRQEMPELQRLRAALGDRRDVEFVLLQAREPHAVSLAWATARGIDLPLYDSGSRGEADAQFSLEGGGKIQDREIAAQFPTTYVIDKRGIVLFSHVGPVARWLEYEGLLRDAAARSGR